MELPSKFLKFSNLDWLQNQKCMWRQHRLLLTNRALNPPRHSHNRDFSTMFSSFGDTPYTHDYFITNAH